MRALYTVGLDLGQANDWTAVSILERVERHQWFDGRPLPTHLHLRYLDRLRRGTAYPDVVRELQRIMGKVGLDSELVVDATGVGRPVVDLFREAGLSVVAVTITAGDATTGGKCRGGENWRVAKRQLVSTLTAQLHSERLRIAAALPLARTLVDELLSFDSRITTSARPQETYGAREGAHDDLVLATALGCWHATRPRPAVGWCEVNTGSP